VVFFFKAKNVKQKKLPFFVLRCFLHVRKNHASLHHFSTRSTHL